MNYFLALGSSPTCPSKKFEAPLFDKGVPKNFSSFYFASPKKIKVKVLTHRQTDRQTELQTRPTSTHRHQDTTSSTTDYQKYIEEQLRKLRNQTGNANNISLYVESLFLGF